jgi:hypothetical protein
MELHRWVLHVHTVPLLQNYKTKFQESFIWAYIY